MNSFLDDITQTITDLYLAGNDGNAIKLILQKWNKSKKTLNINNNKKCAELAREKINAGNKLFVSFPSLTDELLKIYAEAIADAPNDSLELSKAYANRSAVLCNAQMYEDSLKDIDRALINYPDSLKAKLYARKVKNLSALHPKRSIKIQKAVAEARCWMSNLNDADKKVIECRLKERDSEEALAKPFKKPDNSCIVPEITDAHTTLLGASTAVELMHSERFGRHIVATRDIDAGETLIRLKAYASVVYSEERYLPRCWNCLKRAWASVPCKYCVNVMFCDEDCRDEAWNNYHDIECLIINCVLPERFNCFELIGLRLTIKALKEAGSVKLLKEMLEIFDSEPDPCTRGFTGGQLDSSSYKSIYTLNCDISRKSDATLHTSTLLNCSLMIFAWACVSDIFGQDIESMDELIDNEAAIFIGELIMKNMKICEMNAYQAIIYNNEEAAAEGMMLSCLTSYINHNCDSNACIVHSGDIMAVNSLQTIKKGQQIFISYDYHYEAIGKVSRQNHLEDRFNFQCDCKACQENWLPKMTWPSLTDQPLSFKTMVMIGHKLSKFYDKSDLPAATLDKLGDTLKIDIKHIPYITDLLTTLGKFARYPCEEIAVHKFLLRHSYMRHCY